MLHVYRLAIAVALIVAASSANAWAWIAAAQESARLPIIDVHLHAYPADFLGAVGLPNPVTDEPSDFQTDQQILEASLRAMDRYNIVKAVVSGPRGTVEKWRDTEPDRIIASPHFPQFSDAPDMGELRSLLRDGEFQALAELTFQYAGIGPGDPEVEPYFALAEELDVPIGLHMGLSDPGISYGPAPGYRASLGNPLLLEEVLMRHPDARVYVMHAGWPFLDDTIALMWAHPQVYAGLGVLNWMIPREAFHSYLKGLAEAGLGKRLMFGSDQMIWPESDIFYNNAARFFRLDETSPDS